jgi:hypothetical protein
MLASVVPKGNPPTCWPVRWLSRLAHLCRHRQQPPTPASAVPSPLSWPRPSLAQLARPEAQLPAFVAESAVARKYLDLLGPLDWEHFPERPTNRPWPGKTPAARAPLVAAYLIKLNEGKRYMSDLRQYLIENPALVWILGFPLVPDPAAPWGFDVAASLPDRRQLGRVLRELPNPALQFLLGGTIKLIWTELPADLQASFGDAISLDTKNIIAWVKENNLKCYIEDRFDKTKRLKSDPDCRVGCKKRHNKGEGSGAEAAADEAPMPSAATPAKNGTPASHADVGEFYWGYASGVVTTKVPEWGEFVLAELTQPFDKGDTTYFYPLLAITAQRLGRKPRFGALDKAYDCWYVYDYFHLAGGFAAVPLVRRGDLSRQFAADGRPLCAAGLIMPVKVTYWDKTSLIEHECARYACPLCFPQPTGQPCPVNDAHFATGGCVYTTATSIGARLRLQLDRESAEYKAIYHQRTADERINSQAKELGIERPMLRRGSAITNQNTLIYILINLRGLQRVRVHKEELVCQRNQPTLPAV